MLACARRAGEVCSLVEAGRGMPVTEMPPGLSDVDDFLVADDLPIVFAQPSKDDGGRDGHRT